MKVFKSFKVKVLISVVLIASLGASGVVLAQKEYQLQNSQTTTTTIPLKEIKRFATVIANIKRYYIEPVDDEKLFKNAMSGMLSRLDPHSTYLTKQDLQDLQTATSGKFGGIGIEIVPYQGMIKVISPLDDTPASKAGIKAGDIIVRINNKLVKDMNLRDAISMMRGKRGSKVRLTILRKAEKKPLHFVISREVIRLKNIKSELLDKGYAYIRIAFFQNNVQAALLKAVKNLTKKSGGQLNGLILDLRNNPGGLLDAAIAVADSFLDATQLKGNKLIVYTKGKIARTNIHAKAKPGDILENTPIIVLINSGSASASEIVAGALKDHHRAIILGERSFGKGSVQTVIPIDNETGIKLTTALYYTPKGQSIQAKGIEPDVIVADLKIPKSKTQDVVFDPIDEGDLIGHLGNGNAKKANSKTEATKKTKSQTVATNTLTAQKRKEDKLLHKDFQLYEALHLLKGLHAIKGTQS